MDHCSDMNTPCGVRQVCPISLQRVHPICNQFWGSSFLCAKAVDKQSSSEGEQERRAEKVQ